VLNNHSTTKKCNQLQLWCSHNAHTAPLYLRTLWRYTNAVIIIIIIIINNQLNQSTLWPFFSTCSKPVHRPRKGQHFCILLQTVSKMSIEFHNTVQNIPSLHWPITTLTSPSNDWQFYCLSVHWIATGLFFRTLLLYFFGRSIAP